MCEHVVGEEDVGAASLVEKLPGEIDGEERVERRNAAFGSLASGTGRRIDPERRDPGIVKHPQHVAVVGGRLDHEALGTKIPIADEGFGTAGKMLHQGG